MNVESLYAMHRDTPSDINEHLPTLRRLAEGCESVTEFGVRWGCASYAFFAARPRRMRSHDLCPVDPTSPFFVAAKEVPDYAFVRGCVLKLEIEPCDLLFIDTQHHYRQLKCELWLHGSKAKKYIVFHDTETYGGTNEGLWSLEGRSEKVVAYAGGLRAFQGLLPAIHEFVRENPEWSEQERYYNNNGLLVLKKTS